MISWRVPFNWVCLVSCLEMPRPRSAMSGHLSDLFQRREALQIAAYRCVSVSDGLLKDVSIVAFPLFPLFFLEALQGRCSSPAEQAFRSLLSIALEQSKKYSIQDPELCTPGTPLPLGHSQGWWRPRIPEYQEPRSAQSKITVENPKSAGIAASYILTWA